MLSCGLSDGLFSILAVQYDVTCSMNALPYVDQLFREYLLFRGFTSTIQAFNGDLVNDKGQGFQVPIPSASAGSSASACDQMLLNPLVLVVLPQSMSLF